MRSWGESRTCRAFVIRDILRGRLTADPDPHGVRLRGGRISGRLDLENLTTNVSLELRDCLLGEGVVARDAHLTSLSLGGCQLEHAAEAALDADRLTCSVLGLGEVRIIGHADSGAVRLVGAHIGGDLDCTGATLTNRSGPALYADSLQVGQNVFLRDGFTATGYDLDGAVRLVGAHIGGDLDCTGATLTNRSGPALYADSLQVDQNVFLRDGFTATSRSTLPMTAAEIGQLDSDVFTETRSKAVDDQLDDLLAADIGQLDSDTYIYTATGIGANGAVRLSGAHIGGLLDCTAATLHNNSGPALYAEGLQVDQSLLFRSGFTATASDVNVVINLIGARVGGTFVFTPAGPKHTADSHRRLAVDGLTYPGVPVLVSALDEREPVSGRGWLLLLRDGTPRYAAQPYQQLAAGCRALGDERQAREVSMAQRDEELACFNTRWPERLWGKVTKVTLGYGYQPWRALLFLAGVVALSCVLAVVLGWHGALVQAKDTAAPGQPCTVMQRVSVGLDLNLPVGTSLARAGCGLPSDAASATAAWLTGVGWVLRVLAWTFAALFIAGFTSAVRKA